MDEVDFYLEDLKSKFDKINSKDYYLIYSNDKDSKFLYWFIKNYLKNNEIKIKDKLDYKNKKSIFAIRLETMETCFDEKGNFYPIHDLTLELQNQIEEKYNI